MRIGLASPEKIRQWSYGEVKKPETINYRTLRPERDGLFCERIFGPSKDWECHCGKYKRIRYKGVICDRCGVEVTRAKVRRERMGHIELAAPVSHIWYFKGIPSRMGLILDISPRALEKVLYFASYIVLDPMESPLVKKQLLNEAEYHEARTNYGADFKVGMGAEAVKALLEEIDLDQMSVDLRKEVTEVSGQKKIRAIRRLEVVEAFRKSGNKPSWMILDAIPVIPPDLRPMVQLDGGRFATSDLNDLYRRVINRNNRLKRLLMLGAPDIIVRNEKRMLQEAVDSLIDNGRRGRPVTGPGNRALKSLSDMLKGKQGRFRQNLLGKRVDYSGRSVIVVGPELKLHQCGLPKEMALELFKPFVIKKLEKSGMANNMRDAKRKVEQLKPEVWDVLEEVIKEHPVLLNRAPTLHRLGIQAFEPILTEGRALKLHPLACTAYNADFDGDQMAIHLPLSLESQAEARVLMLAAGHILAPKDGKPIIVPTQDMILGSYYLTKLRPGALGEGKVVLGIEEALLAHQHGALDFQAQISTRIDGYGMVKTSLGRMIFNETLPPEIRYFVKDKDGQWWYGIEINKKEMGKLVANCFRHFGAGMTADVIDKVKNLGYHYACVAGISVAVSDVVVPPKKWELIRKTKDDVNRVERQYGRGLMTNDERYKKVVELWTKTTDDVGKAMMDNMDAFNPIFMMADSGARGNASQMRQLAGMRGLMADPSGKIIDLPITANFREGLTVSDYFISSHGARKGLTDTALRTADSGYLTRRLVDVSQDVIVREDDCDITQISLVRERARLADTAQDALAILSDMLIGRVLAADIIDPATDEPILVKDTVLTNADLLVLGDNGVPEITIRGSLSLSEAIANHTVTETVVLGVTDEDERDTIKQSICQELVGKEVAECVHGTATLDDGSTATREIVAAGAMLTEEMIAALLASDARVLRVRNNNVRGLTLTAIMNGNEVTETLYDRILGRCLAEDVVDPATGERIAAINDMITEDIAERICAVRKEVSVRSVLTCKSQYGVCRKCYGRDMANATEVDVGEAVGIIAAQSIGEPGTQLTMRTFHSGGVAGDDITQGLPRVEELFEARKPKHNAIIAENDGTCAFSEVDGVRKIVIDNQEYAVPYGARLTVGEGTKVQKGDKLTEGSINPHDILRVCGMRDTQRYLVYEVQKVYHSQGVDINDKHIEVIVRQMMHKIKIDEAGDTAFLPGEYVDINVFEAVNARVIAEDKMPAVANPILLGITKASLATDSFLSAASFQETTRVLTDAATKGKVDPLIGLKENVIIGKLIPAGTGMGRYRNIDVIEE